MTNEPPLTIMPDTKGWERIVANQRQALYEKEQELERLRAENAGLQDAMTTWQKSCRTVEEMVVIEAARAWHGAYYGPFIRHRTRELHAAVDQLQERMDKEATT